MPNCSKCCYKIHCELCERADEELRLYQQEGQYHTSPYPQIFVDDFLGGDYWFEKTDYLYYNPMVDDPEMERILFRWMLG